MVLTVIKQNRIRIGLVSAISAMAGAFNIWLLSLVSRNARLDHINTAAVGQFVLALVAMISISFLSQTLLSRLSARAFFDLRQQLVEGISKLNVMQVDAMGRHRLYTALSRDVPAIHELVTVMPNYVFNFTVSAASLVYLALVSAKLFAVFAFFLILGLGVAKFAIADRAERRFQQRRGIEDELFKCYEAAIDGNKELKLNRWREDYFLNTELRSSAQRYRKATLAAEFFWNLSNNWSAALIFIGVGALLFSAPYLRIADRNAVITFVMVIFYMIGPLTILMNSFRVIHAAKVGLRRLEELDLDSAVDEVTTTVASGQDPFQSLSLRDVVFTYTSPDSGTDGFTVGPLNLDLQRGELVFFIGGNGSGKTTAAKLLTGLYGRQGGNVLLNEQVVMDHPAYLQMFSAVFQDYYLFDTLIPKKDGKLDASKLDAWLQKLKLTDKVTIEQGRLSTTRLSHGQRKRLALLVACCDDSEIYVFDEWAADQDPEFREFFYRDFLLELKHMGKTMIVVSHDDRYFHLADRLVKFEAGKIVSILPGHEAQTMALIEPETASA